MGELREPHQNLIFDEKGNYVIANNINGYLMDAEDIYVESRQHPISDVPEIGIGNKPIDDGNYLFTRDEMKDFVKDEPKSKPYFRLWLGSDELINNNLRYCLYLGECSQKEINSMPKVAERVENVKRIRLASKSKPTQKISRNSYKVSCY